MQDLKQELLTSHLSCASSCLANDQYESAVAPANVNDTAFSALRNLAIVSLSYFFVYW